MYHKHVRTFGQPYACRCVSEEMIISESFQAIRALRRGKTYTIPYITRKGWEELKYSVPEYKYDVTTTALEGNNNLLTINVRRLTWVEEHRAKKNPPTMIAYRVRSAADPIESTNW